MTDIMKLICTWPWHLTNNLFNGQTNGSANPRIVATESNTEIKPNLQKLHTVWTTSLLSYVNEAEYLGLQLDSKLTFNKHIDCIFKKANLALAFIRWNTHKKDQDWCMPHLSLLFILQCSNPAKCFSSNPIMLKFT